MTVRVSLISTKVPGTKHDKSDKRTKVVQNKNSVTLLDNDYIGTFFLRLS